MDVQGFQYWGVLWQCLRLHELMQAVPPFFLSTPACAWPPLVCMCLVCACHFLSYLSIFSNQSYVTFTEGAWRWFMILGVCAVCSSHVGEWRAEAEVPSWPCSFGHSRLLGESPYCHFHLTGLLHILIVIYELIGWWMFHNFSMLSWNCCLWKSPSKSSYLRMVLFGCSLNCHLSIYAAECFLRQWEWGVHVWIVVKKHELNCWKWAGFSQTVLLLISCYYGRL